MAIVTANAEPATTAEVYSPTMPDTTARQPRVQDITALVGVLAVIEGETRTWPGADLPEWASRVADRLSREGLLAPDASTEELARAIGDLNQRLRYVLGEHDEPDRTS